MKKFILPVIAVFMLIAALISATASPALFIGTLTTVNNSTNISSGITAFTYNQTLQQFSVTHSALTNLTSLRLDIYANVRPDSTNGMIQIGSWSPTTTNAATETFSGSAFAVTNYIFIATVTTNNVSVGGNYGN